MSDLKWYRFDQNNSYGRFDVDDWVCHRLFIQAESKREAIIKAEELGCYWDGVNDGIDCPCCGDRWYIPYEPIDDFKFNNIEKYAQYLARKFGWTVPDARIYYADGTVKEIFS